MGGVAFILVIKGEGLLNSFVNISIGIVLFGSTNPFVQSSCFQLQELDSAYYCNALSVSYISVISSSYAIQKFVMFL